MKILWIMLVSIVSFSTIKGEEPKPVEAIVFDFGGVMAKWKTDRLVIFREMCRLFDESPEAVRPAFKENIDLLMSGFVSDEQFWESFAGKLDKPLPKEWMDYWENQFINTLTFNEPLIEMLGDLKKEGYIVALLSNVFPAHAKALQSAGYYKNFDPLILSCDVKMQKPDPEIFKYMIDQVGKPPHAILYIDDREENIEAAKKLGMQTFLFSYDRESGDVLLERLRLLTRSP